MQMSVPLYKAISRDRGATLDNLDLPLNNRGWLKQRFVEIRQLGDEGARLRAIDSVVNWSDSGPGGYYDDLGNPSMQPHLVRGADYASDPGHLLHPLVGFAGDAWEHGEWRNSWWTDAESMFDAPVELHYAGLDRTAHYSLRVVYGGEARRNRRMRLVANDRFEIHPYIPIERLTEPMQFDIPPEATASGELTLRWTKTPGLGGSGRGCQIAEVWLTRRTP
jgi:hypothetical protein